MGDSLPAASAFAHVMSEFLQNLVVCFPENQGPASALSMLQLVGETAHEAMASAWWKFSRPIAAAIRERDAALTMRAFDESEFQMMRQLGAGTILADSVDAETRASVWQYMDSLTSLSERRARHARHARHARRAVCIPRYFCDGPARGSAEACAARGGAIRGSAEACRFAQRHHQCHPGDLQESQRRAQERRERPA
jgi:hypothetical protein